MLPIVKKSLIGLLLLHACVGAFASGALDVKDVSFDKFGRADWVRMRIELAAGENPIPDARNENFLDSIIARVYLSYGSKKDGFEFFGSKARMVSLEQGENYYLDFFLPGVVVKRGRLPVDPFAYLIELEVSGNKLPFSNDHASGNISQNVAARQSFKSRVNSEGSKNSGVLIPAYLLPNYMMPEDVDHYPAFVRTEADF